MSKEEAKEKWVCHYCKNKYNMLFDRDMHHKTHKEHYEKLFRVCYTLSSKKDKQIKWLKNSREGWKKARERLDILYDDRVKKLKAETISKKKVSDIIEKFEAEHFEEGSDHPSIIHYSDFKAFKKELGLIRTNK